ncbi:MAG: acetolactate decarboxylase [Candidatus Nanopelagicales bacterium]
MAKNLDVRVSDTLWEALHDRAESSGQSVSHLVQAALAEALDVEHHSIFQVSTSGAIVEGLFQGCVSVADLRRHGDLGLGTFEDLDGEMILLDGHCYRARADGSVTEAGDDDLTPFASVVNFAADSVAEVEGITSWAELTAHLDGQRTSANGMVAIRAAGTFASLDLRAACRHASGTDLVTATADQGLFHREGISGTLVGFWSPDYTKSIAIAGYHIHFISDDRQHGGHVLDLVVDRLPLEIQQVTDIHLAIPETTEFLEADFSRDPMQALAEVEHDKRGKSS